MRMRAGLSFVGADYSLHVSNGVNFLNGAIYSINAAALLIGAAGLLSRALGVLRDRLLASEFGASRDLDIYYAAFQIPDFLYTVFLLGAASAAIIPVLLELKARDEEGARQFMARLIIVFSIGSIAVSASAFFLMPFLVRFIAPGFSAGDQNFLITLSRIMLVSPVLLGISNILSAAIQSARIFLIYAVTGIVYNLGIIIGIIFFLPSFGLPGLAAGVILGAALHVSIQVVPFYRLGFRFPGLASFSSFRFALLRDAAFKKLAALSLPRILALSLRQITFIALIAIASTLVSGSIAVLQFSYNLQYIPVGIFGLSFAVAAFPQLTELWISRDARRWVETVAAASRTIFFWVAPVSVLFYVLRAQIVRVALGAGKFDWTDTILTAAVFGVFSVAIAAEALIPLFVRSFYALENTKKPFLIAFFAACLSIFSAFGLVLLFEYGPAAFTDFLRHFLKVGDTEGITVIGLSWAFALGGIVQVILLFFALKGEVRARFSVEHPLRMPWDEFFRISWVSLLAGVVAFGTLRTVNLAVTLDTFLGVFTQGTLSFLAGAVTYAGVLYLFGNREVEELVGTIHRRLFRRDVLPREFDDSPRE